MEHVEAAIDEHIGDPRMRANLVVHEFEALLYADPAACGAYLGRPRLEAAMSAAVAECGAAELVNDDYQTAPSRRIQAVHPTYRKTLDGPALADRIGLAAIRAACPHFDRWVTWLELLSS